MVPAEVLLGVGQMRDCRGGPVAEKIVRVLGLLPEALCGIHREAFSRAATAGAPLQARRYGDPAGVPGGGAGAADAAARGASQEAAEAASLMIGMMPHESLPSRKAGDAWRFAWLPAMSFRAV
jgi:hypothetical protein